jgi:hypothetical protein
MSAAARAALQSGRPHSTSPVASAVPASLPLGFPAPPKAPRMPIGLVVAACAAVLMVSGVAIGYLVVRGGDGTVVASAPEAPIESPEVVPVAEPEAPASDGEDEPATEDSAEAKDEAPAASASATLSDAEKKKLEEEKRRALLEDKKSKDEKDKDKKPKGEFDVNAARSALGAAAGSASGCKKKGGPTGKGRATVTFAPSGRATSAVVSPPFGGTSVGNCVAGIFRGASVPPFTGGAQSVVKSFTVK